MRRWIFQYFFFHIACEDLFQICVFNGALGRVSDLCISVGTLTAYTDCMLIKDGLLDHRRTLEWTRIAWVRVVTVARVCTIIRYPREGIMLDGGSCNVAWCCSLFTRLRVVTNDLKLCL